MLRPLLRRISLLLALLLPFLLPACGGGGGAAKAKAAATTRTVRPQMLPAEDLPASDTGALFGEIRFAGEAPARFPIGARKMSECCAHEDVEHLSDIVIVEEGKLAGVLVRVTRGYPADLVPPTPAEPAVLDQRGCIYTPHVLALRAGQPLEVHNSDPTKHNVNAKATKNASPGNEYMGEGQKPIRLLFEHAESAIHFKCDIHPWMEAQVHVVEHPWFAVTGTDGAFRIEGVPPGTYTIEALHEVYGRLVVKDVRVEAGRATGFALTFEP